MKYKYYLRGAGIGLIVGVLIMAIAIKLQNSTISDAEIIQRAQELGMVYVSDTLETENENGLSSDLVTETETENDNVSDNESSETKQDKTDKEDSKKSDKEDTEAKNKKDADSDSGDESEAEVTEDYITVTIGGSDFSDVVAKKLQRAGVIDDADDFNNYLIANGYDSYIQPGEVDIPAGSTYEEIANILVTKSDER